MLEKRFQAIQTDTAADYRLTGVVMPYGALATLPDGRQERFEPHAFGDLSRADIILNRQHTRIFPVARTGGAGLTLLDTAEALRMAADLSQTSEGRAAWELVKARIVRGLSVEFDAISERQDGHVRVIERALLGGIGLVDEGAYPVATVEARLLTRPGLETRGRLGKTLRAVIPPDKKLSCQCAGGAAAAACRFAKFQGEAVKEMLDHVFAEYAKSAGADLLAVHGRYENPVASLSRKTIRRAGKTGFDIDLPDDDVGRAVVAANESAGVIVRPFLDRAASEFTEAGDTAEYTKARVRALVIESTDQREGWPAPAMKATPDLDEKRQAMPRRRRVWL